MSSDSERPADFREKRRDGCDTFFPGARRLCRELAGASWAGGRREIGGSHDFGMAMSLDNGGDRGLDRTEMARFVSVRTVTSIQCMLEVVLCTLLYYDT